MLRIDPSNTPTPELHQYILGAVAPRPIAFASTMSATGVPNLAPYSFFNAFSSNPPILIFSSNRRVKGNSTKDTLHNVQATGEVVINVVTHNMVRQMALASIEYPPDVSEFVKAGFTPIKSEIVKPYRVKESPVQFECKVAEIKPLGKDGGAGNLIICEIVLIHINEKILEAENKIDPQKIDLVGRMGRAFYNRAHGRSIFQVYQPVNKLGIGFDQLPEWVKTSKVLTGNELGMLASIEQMPEEEAVMKMHKDPILKEICHRYCDDEDVLGKQLYFYIRDLLAEGRLDDAWKVILLKERDLIKKS